VGFALIGCGQATLERVEFPSDSDYPLVLIALRDGRAVAAVRYNRRPERESCFAVADDAVDTLLAAKGVPREESCDQDCCAVPLETVCAVFRASGTAWVRAPITDPWVRELGRDEECN